MKLNSVVLLTLLSAVTLSSALARTVPPMKRYVEAEEMSVLTARQVAAINNSLNSLNMANCIVDSKEYKHHYIYTLFVRVYTFHSRKSGFKPKLMFHQFRPKPKAETSFTFCFIGDKDILDMNWRDTGNKLLSRALFFCDDGTMRQLTHVPSPGSRDGWRSQRAEFLKDFSIAKLNGWTPVGFNSDGVVLARCVY